MNQTLACRFSLPPASAVWFEFSIQLCSHVTSTTSAMAMPSTSWNSIQRNRICYCRPAKIIRCACGTSNRMCAWRYLAASKGIVMKCWALILICSAIASCLRAWIIRWKCGVWTKSQSTRPLRRATHSMHRMLGHSVRWMSIFPTIRHETSTEITSTVSSG